MDTSTFWTVLKADAVFAGCSFVVTLSITLAIAIWQKRKRKKIMAAQKREGPGAIMLGGVDPKPGHCPLCGKEWSLPGPVIPMPVSERK